MSAAIAPPAARGPRWPDVVAALSIAGLLLPEAVAYSSLANLPPQAGVAGLFAGLLCYGLVGSSRFAIVSATSSSAAVLAAATASMGATDMGTRLALSVGLIFLTGLVFFLGAAARLGNVSAFIAKPVLRGFTFGLALTICIKQLPKIMAVTTHSGNVAGVVAELAMQVHHAHPASLAVGAAALVLLFVLERWRRVPAALVVIVMGIAAGYFAHLQALGVASVGPMTLTLEPGGLPDLARDQWQRLGELSFAVALILYAESYGSMRTFAIKHGDGVSPNRDLAALGLANVVSALFRGMPVGAGFSATSANEAAGAQSRWAAWAAAAVLAFVMALCLPLIAYTPEPVLAAIVIHAVSQALHPRQLRPYFLWRRDRLVLVGAIIAVLALGVLDGLLLAIAASLLITLRELAEARLSVLGRLGEGHDFVNLADHPQAHGEPGLLILRPEVPLFFGNVEPLLGLVRKQMQAQPAVRAVVLSLEESYDLDGTCVEALHDLATELKVSGKRLVLARLKDRAHDVLLNARLPELPPEGLSTLSVDDAVQRATRAVEPRSAP
jgi:MFS superfamily sulfate permease-like transporter